MVKLLCNCIPITILLLLMGCSRDVVVATELADSGNLRPGDSVLLAQREVGTVSAIEMQDQRSGFAVEISLSPEHAELVQSNAIAYLAPEGPPSLVLMNPTATAAPVAPGDRLQGLTPLEAALWRAGTAAEAISGVIDQFSQNIGAYLQSDEWAQARAEIDAGIAELASDSRQAAESLAREMDDLFDSINDRAAAGAQKLAEEMAAIEQEIKRLEAEGHNRLAEALRRLRERIEAFGQSNREQKPIEA